MVKEKKVKPQKRHSLLILLLYILIGSLFILFIVMLTSIYYFEKNYRQKIYPGVRIDGVIFGGKTSEETENYFVQKSQSLKKLKITLSFENKVATFSGEELAVSFDGRLLALQAYSVGRSGHLLSDLYQKWQLITSGINLSGVTKMNNELLEETLDRLSNSIDIPAEDALFQFEKGKVILFRLSKSGRQLNKNQTKQFISSYISASIDRLPMVPQETVIGLPVETIEPRIRTEDSNDLGIRELIGIGTSKFAGSILSRIHNIELAATKINGHLVPPNAIFSFNDTLGDVSATTGFQPAYIIKEGRTVLGDGGGVCQVSTTLFRAVLNSGLEIVERHPHAYRVSYYEQDSNPGIDATVFAPGYDLKFKNNTQNYILIQAKVDKQNYSLAFEIYGTNDGRKVEITKPIILSQTPPPEDLYQDDLTLARGIVKQVDWKAWGAKVNFDYKVTRNGELLTQQSFFSNYRPWQAVFLRGIRE